MRADIIYDSEGRLRFRCGQLAFEKHDEKRIEQELLSYDGITSVKATSSNGGILVMYKGNNRNRIIDLVRKLDTKSLTAAEGEASLADEIDEKFREDLTKLIVKRVIHKFLIPSSLRPIITVIKGAKYILNALGELLTMNIDVDVLDGASITACLAKKDYKTAGSVMFMLSVSSLLESYTKEKAKAALTESLMIKTEKLWLVDEDGERLVPMSELKTGNCVRIRTGSIIPVDGEVAYGQAEVNEASMTGEAVPVSKMKGSSVFAGTVIENGSIVVCIRALASDTRISQIADLISRSESLKSQLQSRAEVLADSIVPYSFMGFFAALLLTGNVNRAVSLLMVDFSCAIKLSVPISVISVIREAADHDITVKGGKYLEEYAAADTIAFDKTGTLTNAEPKLTAVVPFGDYEENEVLKIAACIEEHFPHSVARAIVNAASIRGITHAEEHSEVIYIVAHGTATNLYGKRTVIGSRHFVAEDEGVAVSQEQQRIIDEKAEGSSVVFLAIGGELAGALCISDPPRSEAKNVITQLRKQGFESVVMLTGDSKGAAEHTAKVLGIDDYYYQVLPENKHSYIRKLREKGHRVIMVGDGINDSPALAEANVSAAMSDASDIAKETADITLRSCDLYELVRMRILSRRLMNRINGNYRFILAFNSALMVLGFFGVISPSFSALLHNGSTMLICAKSMTPLLDDEHNT